ncbi:DUF1631 domain-containing protein [Arhodomonas sp. AD133]|uniref:DUF1631 domain-containing protein n=1 Tax=Arhodomonas sp. AD133 TaxID=3415009 RepID=UPI003EBB6BD9
MSARDKIVLLQGGAGGRKSAVMDELRRLATERLVRAATRTLDRGDDALFERAERANQSQSQEECFAAMRELRLQRRRVVARFRERLEEGFRRLAQGDLEGIARLEQTEPAELSLVDDHRLEEDVAVDSTGARLRGRHASLLGTLEARLEDLLEAERLPMQANPVHPHTIAVAFSLALADVQITLTPRLILYKLLERCLDNELPAVYKAMDERLERAGARGRRQVRNLGADSDSDSDASDTEPTQPEPVESPADTSDDEAGTSPEPSSGEEADGEVVELLERLIGRAKYGREPAAPGGASGGGPVSGGAAGGAAVGGGGPGGGPGGGGPGGGGGGGGAGAGGAVADARLVLRALTSLQEHILDQQEVDPDRIKAAVNAWLDEHGHATVLERSVDDVIDIVSMLFENILDDPRLAPALRVVIARLQVPVLKVALRDRRVFGQSDHPARCLINELADASTGWTQPAEPENDPLYSKMTAVVDRVVERFRDDVRVFDVALRDFRYFRERERERAEAIEERTRQAAEGNLKVEAAREAVQAEVEQRIDAQVPDVVRRLLEEAWFRVLFITAVREGREGEAWRHQVGVMDQLVWSVRPKSDAAERQRMLELMPRLLQDLREGLNAIMYNPYEMTQLFRELEAVHLKCLTPGAEPPVGSEGAVSATQSQTPSQAAEGPATNLSVWGDRPADDEDLARVRALSQGEWLDLRDQDPPVRAKLSARLNGGQRYVFVNRAGFRVAEYSAEDLARALREGDVMELADVVAFDHALERVIETLKEIHGP